MITDLETLLNLDEFKKLVEAINKNQKYCFSNNGLTIKAESTDDSLHLAVSYDRQKEESNLARKENEAFQKYLESMDDELFIAVCDHLDNIEIHKIQDCLASNNLETVRAGIAKFKSAASEVVRRKIEQLKAYV